MEHKTITSNPSIGLILAGIAAVAAVANLVATPYFVSHGVESFESLKAGGPENLVKIKELYNSQMYKDKQTEGIQSALDSMKAEGGSDASAKDKPTPPKADAAPVVQTLDATTLASVLKDAYFIGATDGSIAIIEYSDFECPYCQKHHENGTLDAVLAANKDVKLTLKQYPLPFHKLAQKSSEGALCVAKIAGAAKYMDFAHKIFASKNPSIDNVIATATSMGINTDDLKKCIDSNEMATRISNETAEGQKIFNVTGTPGNVVLNTKTGKYVVIAGAYHVEAFTAAIAQVK